MYHDLYRISGTESGFQNQSAFQYKIQVDEFEQQVAQISAYCQTHPMVEVEFTFDDGGISFLTLAAPILEKYGLKGTFFISTHYLNTPLFLSSEQLQELVERGHRIGAHSHTHPVLTNLSESEIADEWNISVREISKVVDGNIRASIPNGNGNDLVMQKASEAGIKYLYTSVPTTKVQHVNQMVVFGRYVVYRGMNDVLSIIASRRKRKYLYFKWLFVRLLKRLLGNYYNSLKQFFIRRK